MRLVFEGKTWDDWHLIGFSLLNIPSSEGTSIIAEGGGNYDFASSIGCLADGVQVDEYKDVICTCGEVGSCSNNKYAVAPLCCISGIGRVRPLLFQVNSTVYSPKWTMGYTASINAIVVREDHTSIFATKLFSVHLFPFYWLTVSVLPVLLLGLFWLLKVKRICVFFTFQELKKKEEIRTSIDFYQNRIQS